MRVKSDLAGKEVAANWLEKEKKEEKERRKQKN